MAHLIVLVADHGAKFPFGSEAHGFDAEARTENAIQGCGSTAALKITEHRATRFFAGASSDFLRDDSSNSAIAVFFSLRISASRAALGRTCTFRAHD